MLKRNILLGIFTIILNLMWNPLFVFRIADDDKDGKLSSEEVIAHYDTFVGSQATGYIRFFIDCLIMR